MKWTNTPIGATRSRRKFLLMPKRIGMEWRWLEVAEWEEKFSFMGSIYDPWFGWCPVRWINADDAAKEQR